jgi:hypothetical protein
LVVRPIIRVVQSMLPQTPIDIDRFMALPSEVRGKLYTISSSIFHHWCLTSRSSYLPPLLRSFA